MITAQWLSTSTPRVRGSNPELSKVYSPLQWFIMNNVRSRSTSSCTWKHFLVAKRSQLGLMSHPPQVDDTLWVLQWNAVGLSRSKR
ncbi:hypothetical protein TNCV_183491 [Trichonephila clavipes]|nr:hypothetical protein TNCV_183491 [Trichonephila clavipes]